MSAMLTVSLSSELLDSGAAEERATFGLFAVTANDRLLTEGEDTVRGRLCHGPHVAGYPLAEWFAWNWWRLRWESSRPTGEDAKRRWDFAHRMAAVGEGYAWPDITIFSDGVQSFLASEPSPNADKALFRYIGSARRETVSTAELETAVDGFLEGILSRLDGRKLRETNLHRLWNDLRTERNDPEVERFRRLEAHLGCDPDEVDEGVIRRRLDDATTLGEEALGEVAADAAFAGHGPDRMMSAQKFVDTAHRSGFDTNARDAVALTGAQAVPQLDGVEAWRVGECVAQTLRDQESLDGNLLSDQRLADYAGTTSDAIRDDGRRSNEISFVLDQDGGHGRISLRSKWQTGRRFDLARLVGDRVLGKRMSYADERLLPATRTYSYRQKVQRAFAAEFLSPFASVKDMLDGDYSEEKQTEVAGHFNVSPMTIRTQLVHHGLIGLDDAPDIASRGAAS